MKERIMFCGRRTGKTKKMIEMLDNEGVEFYFSFDDFEHNIEIRQQIIAMTGHNCKINWCVGFDRFLKCKKSLIGEE